MLESRPNNLRQEDPNALRREARTLARRRDIDALTLIFDCGISWGRKREKQRIALAYLMAKEPGYAPQPETAKLGHRQTSGY